MLTTLALRTTLQRSLARVLALGASLIMALTQPSIVGADADVLATITARSFPFDEADCGPPSTMIPGPPPELIVVGQPMSDSWLMCYLKRDFEGQTFYFERWGEIRKAVFRGYPVECWSSEAGPGSVGRRTNGIVAQVFGWNLDHTQYVRFTYRIQMDGDYINNCQQEILPGPPTS